MPNFSGIWSTAQQFQARGQDIWPRGPGAPTIGTATAGTNKCASVTFTAPACTGKYPAGVSTYTVTSTPGGFTASGAASPLTVTGLTAGTSYTFKVKANGSGGLTGPCSAASNSITAIIKTCATYTTAGTYSWVAPACVSSVAVLAIGGGGGGAAGSNLRGAGGGGLGYKNAISVTPGNSYSVVVGVGGTNGVAGTRAGTSGGQSNFNCVVFAGGGASGASGGTGGTYSGTGVSGGTGGAGALGGGASYGGGGGGAAGYAGNGGAGGSSVTCGSRFAGAAGTGGGGGGGGGGNFFCCGSGGGGGGGGVGLFGQGSNGAGGATGVNVGGGGGGAGSGGTAGLTSTGYYSPGSGGAYGGGGGGAAYFGCACHAVAGYGAVGAVRIVWCVSGIRGTPSFPSTNVGA